MNSVKLAKVFKNIFLGKPSIHLINNECINIEFSNFSLLRHIVLNQMLDSTDFESVLQHANFPAQGFNLPYLPKQLRTCLLVGVGYGASCLVANLDLSAQMVFNPCRNRSETKNSKGTNYDLGSKNFSF